MEVEASRKVNRKVNRKVKVNPRVSPRVSPRGRGSCTDDQGHLRARVGELAAQPPPLRRTQHVAFVVGVEVRVRAKVRLGCG